MTTIIKFFFFGFIKVMFTIALMTIIITLIKSGFDYKLLFNNFYSLAKLYAHDNDFYIQYIVDLVILRHIYTSIFSKEKKIFRSENALSSEMFQKAKMLPKNFDFFNVNDEKKFDMTQVQDIDYKDKIFDELVKEEDGLLIYKNRSGKIGYDKYLNEKENIKQYFDVDENKDIKITRFKHNQVKIDLVDRFPKDYKWDNKRHLKEGKIFFGTNEIGEDLFIDINKLTHYFINGASGSGKTIFIYQFLQGVFYNIDMFEKVVLVDLKEGVSFNKYIGLHEKIEVVDTLEGVYTAVSDMIKENKKRAGIIKERQRNGEYIDKLEGNPILFLIDEFAEIKNGAPNADDKEKTKLHKQMIQDLNSLAARARSQNIKMMIITQKGTIKESGVEFKDNLQSKILLKVKSTDAIKSCLSSLETIETLGVTPQKFGYGRIVMEDDSNPSGMKVHYIQSCFVPNDNHLHLPNFQKENKQQNNVIEEEQQEETQQQSDDFDDSIFLMKEQLEDMKKEKEKYNDSDFKFMNDLIDFLHKRDAEQLKKIESKILERLQQLAKKKHKQIPKQIKEETKEKLDINKLDTQRKNMYNLLMKKTNKSTERTALTKQLISYKNNINNNNIKEFNELIEQCREYYRNNEIRPV